ncbi:MAG: hypothetical protein ACI4UX_00995 [Clostridia bacterium]
MFRNRGEMPSINTGNNAENEGGYSAPHYSNYWNGRFIIIQYDRTFVAIEVISVFLILLIVASAYLFTYKTWFEDPIATIKNNFLTAQLVSIITSLGLIGLVTWLTKSSKENLIRNLKIIAIACAIVIFIFLGIKINMDRKYNQNTFGEFYENYEKPKKNSKDSNKIEVSLADVKILDPKEAYIEESTKAYTVFTIKTILYMVIHTVIVILTMYLSHRLTTIEEKKQKLAKDDLVLYDDEQNVKY